MGVDPINTQFYQVLKWYGGKTLATSSEDTYRGVYLKSGYGMDAVIGMIKSRVGSYRVPTYEDVDDLITGIGGSEFGYKLANVDTQFLINKGFTLTDQFGFNWISYGYGVANYPYTGSFTWKSDGIALELSIASNPMIDDTYPYAMAISDSSGKLLKYRSSSDNINYYDYLPIRLCKDAT